MHNRTVTEGEEVKRDTGTDSLRRPQESKKTNESYISLAAVETLKTLVSSENKNTKPET